SRRRGGRVSMLGGFKNVEVGDNTDHVTVAVNSGPSSNRGGTLTRTVSGGVAVFGDLSLNTAGTYTLKATSATQPSLAQVNSSSRSEDRRVGKERSFPRQPTN